MTIWLTDYIYTKKHRIKPAKYTHRPTDRHTHTHNW